MHRTVSHFESADTIYYTANTGTRGQAGPQAGVQAGDVAKREDEERQSSSYLYGWLAL